MRSNSKRPHHADSSAISAEVLLLGPAGGGKSLLLKRIEALSKTEKPRGNNAGHHQQNLHERLSSKGRVTPTSSEFHDMQPLMPTVGMQYYDLSAPSSAGKIRIRELGGAMAPTWKNYVEDADAIMFVLDPSDPCQLTLATVQLLELLAVYPAFTRQILIICNKSDATRTITNLEAKSFMMLDSITRNIFGSIQQLEASALTGSNLDKVIAWLDHVGRSPSSTEK